MQTGMQRWKFLASSFIGGSYVLFKFSKPQFDALSSLPPSINTVLASYATDQTNLKICGDCDIYKFTSTSERDSVFLKAGLSDSLTHEVEILKWLKTQKLRFRIPTVIEYAEASFGGKYLVTSEIQGKNSHEVDLSPHQVVKIMAKLLREIHGIDCIRCPLEYNSRDENESIALQMMKNNFPEDRVFLHGDYYLPNVVIDVNAMPRKRLGVLDWHASGVGDRMIDVRACMLSIEWNLGCEYIDEFLDHYGLSDEQKEKLQFLNDNYPETCTLCWKFRKKQTD